MSPPLPYLHEMKLPRRVRRHTDFALATPDAADDWDELAHSKPAIPRLGPTIWYKPGAGRRSIALLHRPDTSELRVEDCWTLNDRTYSRNVYSGSDVYAAVETSNAAFADLAKEGYKIHDDGAATLAGCFGFGTHWIRGPLFSVKSSLAVIDYHEKQHAHEIADQAAQLAAAEARGLVPAVVTLSPSPRSRQSGLAERAVTCNA